MKVYKAIGAVSAAMSHSGIGKGRRNQQQGYNFRGIDDVLNSLSTALVNAGLVILPRCVARDVVERTTAKGSAIFYVTCRVEFDLVCTEDGSTHTVCTYGEAMDSADKATNKAMSAAYKYLALLVFCIPTEASAETDADYSTHDVKRADEERRAAREAELDETALYMIDCHEQGNDLKAIALWYEPSTWTGDDEQEERKYVWSRLQSVSKLRSAIKANKPEAVKVAEKAGQDRGAEPA